MAEARPADERDLLLLGVADLPTSADTVIELESFLQRTRLNIVSDHFRCELYVHVESHLDWSPEFTCGSVSHSLLQHPTV